MKLFKYGLRIWIGIVSIVSFLLGWVFFAHSTKPAAAQSQQTAIDPLPTLAPLPQIGDNNTTIQPLPQLSFQPSNSGRSFLRSFGS